MSMQAANTQLPPDRQEPGCLKSCFSILGTGGILIAALLVLYGLLWAAGALLVVADPQKNVDAAVALSGGELDRVQEAARLYDEQIVKWVIITETGQEIPELGSDYTTLLKNEIRKLGVPEDAILVTEKEVSSTYDEAKAVRQLLLKNDFKSCIVITDPFHTFRTRLKFREAFDETGLTVRVRPVRGHWYRSSTWMFSIRGWQATLTEYIKIGGYLLGFSDNILLD